MFLSMDASPSYILVSPENEQTGNNKHAATTLEAASFFSVAVLMACEFALFKTQCGEILSAK